MVQAGAWSPRLEVFVPVHPQPCALIGATLSQADQPDAAWREWLQRTGGVATELPPSVLSVCLNPAALAIAESVEWRTLDELIALLHEHGVRIVRHAALDVAYDEHLRALEVVTSLQRGGAERLVLSLHRELPKQQVASTLCVLGSPTRASFESPPGVISLKHLPFDSVQRARGIDEVARRSGSDVIHAHLIEGETAAWLTNKGWSVMVTLHNERVGWQTGFDETLPCPANLMLIACSSAVARDARSAMPKAMLRTAWNGINAGEFQVKRRAEWRERLRIDQDALVFLVLANPRPQKRLAKVAEVFAALNKASAVLVLAGEPSMIHESAAAEVARFWAVIDAHGLRDRVRVTGAVEDVAGLLSASDLLLSASAHEGMSLAQLEAIAAGLRLVITDVGGSAELASIHQSVVVVSKDAEVAEFVAAIDECLTRAPSSLAWDFSAPVMAMRHRWLMRVVLRRRSGPGRGVLLVTNNFSTGGAQSSARRLLLGLRDAGMHVRAATLQEWPEHPTPGRQALVDAGIEVIATPPPDIADATVALSHLLDATDRDPPEAVLFWNVMPEYKVLLAEAFDDVPVIDVSPGEMLFDSLQRYFKKPRAGSPYRSVPDYARMLAAVVVKHTQEAEQAREWFGVPVRVIANGVMPRPAARGTVRTTLVIGTAARLHPHKRLEDLIEAFRWVCEQRRDVMLRIAGGEDEGFGEYAVGLRSMAKDLPVEWLGHVSDIAAFHAELDVFAMISEPIGCPNASLEAMAAGLPVVATAVGGAMDQIVDGESGLLTTPRDADSLATALLRVLDDEALRARLGAAARERVSLCFSLEKMVRSYAELIGEVNSLSANESSHLQCSGKGAVDAVSVGEGLLLVDDG